MTSLDDEPLGVLGIDSIVGIERDKMAQLDVESKFGNSEH